MKDHIDRLIDEIERAISGTRFGHQSPGNLTGSVQTVHEAILDGAIEAEKRETSYGTRRGLLV